eukprot:3979042-Alexandrium_andersonii.AAC.1
MGPIELRLTLGVAFKRHFNSHGGNASFWASGPRRRAPPDSSCVCQLTLSVQQQVRNSAANNVRSSCERLQATSRGPLRGGNTVFPDTLNS